MSRISKSSKALEKLTFAKECASSLIETIEEVKLLLSKPIPTKDDLPVVQVKVEVAQEPEKFESAEEETVQPALKKPKKEKHDPIYTCICGKQLSLSSRKRHESTTAHQAFVTASCESLLDLA